MSLRCLQQIKFHVLSTCSPSGWETSTFHLHLLFDRRGIICQNISFSRVNNFLLPNDKHLKISKRIKKVRNFSCSRNIPPIMISCYYPFSHKQSKCDSAGSPWHRNMCITPVRQQINSLDRKKSTERFGTGHYKHARQRSRQACLRLICWGCGHCSLYCFWHALGNTGRLCQARK